MKFRMLERFFVVSKTKLRIRRSLVEGTAICSCQHQVTTRPDVVHNRFMHIIIIIILYRLPHVTFEVVVNVSNLNETGSGMGMVTVLVMVEVLGGKR